MVAVTGDDEDNILISQVAREKYGVERVVARCNNPRNLQHFELLGVKPAISATDLILRLIEHEVPQYGLVHLLDLPEERLEIIELEVAEDCGRRAQGQGPRPARRLARDLDPARRRRLRPSGDSVVEAGDEVLLVLDVGARGPGDRALLRPLRRGPPSVARRNVDHLLIGGGLASANCARWLREEGADGSVLLVGREPDPPYNRPPLSKGYLQGKESREDALFRPDEWWGEQEIELMTRTSVMKLDPAERVATLSNKDEVEFDKALVATGANVRRVRVDGCDLDGIHYLRAFGNSDAIRADAEQAERAVLIGGSYIGCEVAASLTAAHGVKCSIVMQEDVTLERQFGAEVGGFFQGVLEEHGVEVHGGDELERFEGSDGRVRKVVTKGGLELDCDMVVIGVGVIPDVTLARAAGLELGESGGVLCSSRLESSVPGIFAAGDICEYESPIHDAPLRMEHWDVAFNQGKTAALNMLGREVEHEVVPYFFSDLADWASMEYVGPARATWWSAARWRTASSRPSSCTRSRPRGRGADGRPLGRPRARAPLHRRGAPDREALADEGRTWATLAGLTAGGLTRPRQRPRWRLMPRRPLSVIGHPLRSRGTRIPTEAGLRGLGLQQRAPRGALLALPRFSPSRRALQRQTSCAALPGRPRDRRLCCERWRPVEPSIRTSSRCGEEQGDAGRAEPRGGAGRSARSSAFAETSGYKASSS